MAKVHFTQPAYLGRGACQWDDKQKLQVSEDISEVTCRRCLLAITPNTERFPSTEQLQANALQHNQK